MPDHRGTDADRQRLTDLFRQHGDDIYAYAALRLETEDAEDAVSEVFTVAWQKLSTVRRGEERPWLFGVARRVVLARRRRNAGAGIFRQRLLAAGVADADDHGESTVERRRVMAALERLSEKEREALLLRYWLDLSVSEAATAAGCSTTAFGVRLHRARRRLRDALDRHDVGRAPRLLRAMPHLLKEPK
ncbi:RNA polymerase sigma factor [Asanoa ferruginea]|uniref:RNA polymerase sigma factor n=1 Tax=Asanoa ferruginea TaxID=53367 RepID=UPI0014776784|nr:sigma-70 family RNA polymerase sigma factor [Asanoa ferruginea]